MKGRHTVIIKNRRLQYKFALERNLTILRGDSATGKTTLIDMLASYQQNGESSGITVVCDKECTVLTGIRWQSNLPLIHDSIVFIDEGDAFVLSREFAAAIKDSDNYYVIATRSSLFNLPYSVNEIYGIKNVSGNKYQGTKRIYSEFYPLCKTDINTIQKPDCVIVEDANSGYEFYKSICDVYGIRCITSDGKSNMYQAIRENNDGTILAVADGAAFGPEIERVLALKKAKNLIIYLPESFEWILLKSGLVEAVGEILNAPYDYIESSDYFSWERFFTALLISRTKDHYLAYSKTHLNPNYLHENESGRIKRVMPDMDWGHGKASD